MLIYKNVKGNKCSGDNTYAECNKALDPNEYDNKNGKGALKSYDADDNLKNNKVNSNHLINLQIIIKIIAFQKRKQ